jgi:DNA-binding transcriptional LysR family regulator
MDTELARTFLTVVTAGNFISAADRLHVSQSTVSTRIHTLEDQLGSGLIDYSQKMTTAAMQIADMKVWAHRS